MILLTWIQIRIYQISWIQIRILSTRIHITASSYHNCSFQHILFPSVEFLIQSQPKKCVPNSLSEKKTWLRNTFIHLDTFSGGLPASVASLASSWRSNSSSQTLDQNSIPCSATSSVSAFIASSVIANRA